MPLANDGRLVAGFAKQFWKRHLRTVELVPVGHKAILVAVQTSQDHGAAGTTNRIRAEAFPENHSVGRQRIDVWCWVHVGEQSLIGTDGVVGVVVAEDKHNVRFFLSGQLAGKADELANGQQRSESQRSQSERGMFGDELHSVDPHQEIEHSKTLILVQNEIASISQR